MEDNNIPLLPAEIVGEIFLQTNVETVLRGRATCKTYHRWLIPTLHKLSRPKNFILSTPCHRYDKEYMDQLNLLDNKKNKYIPGSVPEKYKNKSNPEEGFTGFTLLFDFNVSSERDYKVLFGYSNKRYVIYLFDNQDETHNVYIRRCVVHDLNNLQETIIKLIRNMEYQDTTYFPMVVGSIYDIIAELPSNKYPYRLLGNNIPCTSMDEHIDTCCNGRTIYSDSPELLGDVLTASCNVILEENVFKEHKRILNRYNMCYSERVTYGIYPSEATNNVRFIATKYPEKYPKFVLIAPNTLERIDDHMNIDVLVNNFDNLINPSTELISKILLHYSNCGRPATGLHVVIYAREHKIESELIVAASYTILYYALSKDQAENRVMTWLLAGNKPTPNLWERNWQYYSEGLRSMLSNNIPYRSLVLHVIRDQ